VIIPLVLPIPNGKRRIKLLSQLFYSEYFGVYSPVRYLCHILNANLQISIF